MDASLPENRFKRRLAEGGTQWGLWCSLADPAVGEIMALARPDWLLLDLEHSPADLTAAANFARAVGALPFAVRVPSDDPVFIKRILDCGVQTLFIPQICSAGEAAAAVAACRYPPAGIRGVAGSTRAAAYGARGARLADLDREIAPIVQIETLGALAQVEQIAATPGLSALFAGPSDLAAAMGHLGRPDHPDVQAALARIGTASHAAGLPCGIYAGTPEVGARYQDMGFDFITAGHDVALLMRSAEAALEIARQNRPLGSG